MSDRVADRRIRAHRRHPLRRPRRARRFDRLVVRPPLRRSAAVRPARRRSRCRLVHRRPRRTRHARSARVPAGHGDAHHDLERRGRRARVGRRSRRRGRRAIPARDRPRPPVVRTRTTGARPGSRRPPLRLRTFGGARRVSRRTGALVCELGDLAVADHVRRSHRSSVERSVDFEVRPGNPVTIVVTVARRSPLIVVPPAVAVAELARDEAGWRTWAAGIEVADHRERGGAQPHHPATAHLLAVWRASGRRDDLAARAASAGNATGTIASPGHVTPAIGVAAFLGAGRPQEARAFLAWLLHATRLSRPRLPVLFTLDGRPGPQEVELVGLGRLRRQPPRSHRQRCRPPAPARCLRLGPRRRLAPHRSRPPALRRDLASRRRVGRLRRRHLERARRRDLGAPRCTGPPRPLQADGVVGPRPGDPHRRRSGGSSPPPAAKVGSARTRRPRRRHPHPRVRPRRRGPTPVPTDRPSSTPPCCFPLLEFEPPASPRLSGTIAAIQRHLGAGGPLLYRYPPGTDGLARKGGRLPALLVLARPCTRPRRSPRRKPRHCSTNCSPSPVRSACTAMFPAQQRPLETIVSWMWVGVPRGWLSGPVLGAEPTRRREAALQGAVGALGVVDLAEPVELGLQLGDGGGWGLFGEPFLERLVEPFDLAVALGMVGAGVTGSDTEVAESGGKGVAERFGVVGPESCRQAEERRRGGDDSEHERPCAGRQRCRRDAVAAVIVEDVEDLDFGGHRRAASRCRRAPSTRWLAQHSSCAQLVSVPSRSPRDTAAPRTARSSHRRHPRIPRGPDRLGAAVQPGRHRARCAS